MIYSISGRLTHSEPVDTYYLAVVECGGIGYELKTTHTSMSQLKPDEPVRFYTYLYVREDALELFGFYDERELNCFKQLISVSGVGPRVGLSILSALSPDAFAVCVASGDAKSIARAKGVGAKVSQRIVLELRDKISNEQLGDSFSAASAGPAAVGDGVAEQALSALAALGYTRAEATRALSGAPADATVEALIKYGLKALAG